MLANTTHRLAAAMAVLAVLLVSGACETGPAPTGPLSGEQRIAALERFTSTLRHDPGMEAEEQAGHFADMLKAAPEIADAGVSSTGNVWARFIDGRPFVVVNNRPPNDLPIDEDDETARPRPAKAIPGNRVHLINGFSSGWRTEIPILERLFTDFGYTLSADGQKPSLAAWKNLEPAGVYHIASHGGTWQLERDGPEDFIMLTNILWNYDVEQALDDDYDAHRVVPAGDPFTHKIHVGITAAFIRQYVDFEPGSLVFMNTCEGDHPAAADFKAACFEKGAGAYVGWSESVKTLDAEAAAYFAYDKMLGANLEITVGEHALRAGPNKTVIVVPRGPLNLYLPPRADPLRRPFGFGPAFGPLSPLKAADELFTARGTPGVRYDTSRGSYGGADFEAKLRYTPAPGGDFFDTPFILNPSIWYVKVDEAEDKLYLYAGFSGDFGPPSGERAVTVDGVDMTGLVETWTHDEIVLANFPRSGAGSYGEVRVIRNGTQRSNPRWLTLFRGVDYSHTRRIGGENRFIRTRWINLSFRVDIGLSRDAPYLDPRFVDRGFPLYPVQSGSSFMYETGGSDDLDNGTTISFASNLVDLDFTIPEMIYKLPDRTYTVYMAALLEPGQPGEFVLEPSAYATGAFDINCEHTDSGSDCGGADGFPLGNFNGIFAHPFTNNLRVPLNPDTGLVEIFDSVPIGFDIDEFHLSPPAELRAWPDEMGPL